MVKGCGNKCVKYFFFLINFLFFALGGVVCGLSLWIRFDNQFQSTVFGIISPQGTGLQLDTLYLVLYILAGIGLAVCILGFFGCCGSCMESLCVLGIYFSIVLALFVILLAGGIYVLVTKDQLKTNFINLWRQELVNNYNTVPQTVRTNIDSIQTQLNCCGATGCQDFAVPPASCNCTFNGLSSPRQGCATYLFDLINNNFVIAIVIAVLILLVELIAMILACIICHAIRDKRNNNL